MTRTVVVSITEAGRRVAARIPGTHAHGSLAATVRREWDSADALVLVTAVGAAVRVIAPLLSDKARDPAVVCVDDGGSFVIPLAGGHGRGANELARDIAIRLGATAVVTTASERAGVPVLDGPGGWPVTGAVATVQRALVDGDPVAVDADPALAAYRVLVTDRRPPVAADRPTAYLHPPTLVIGVGASSGAPVDEVAALVETALADAGLDPASIGAVATIDVKAGEPAIRALGHRLRTYRADQLRAVTVPTPSPVVEDAVGTPSVAEAAALLAAGPGGELLVTKRVSAHATVAIARRRQPRGELWVTGLGPGASALRAPAATAAVTTADVVIGYGPYLELCADLLTPAQEIVASPIGDETVRAKQAVAEAESGRRVALVCSGDAGVYAMAALVFEVAPDPTDCDIEVVPGITAATAAAALLGAPLAHDHAAVSLSDLLTEWPVIERRLDAVAAADFVVALYNPRSRGRAGHLDAARAIFLRHRGPDTVVGVVTDAYRPGQHVAITTLAGLDAASVGMTSIVVVGASTTRVIGGRMVTPRGYSP